MAGFNIFENDAFSVTELTQAINKAPYTPNQLGQMAIFQPKSIRTEDFWIEQKEGKLAIIPTSERGSEAQQNTPNKRKAKGFKTTRVARDSVIAASELFNVRAFGTESELEAVSSEVGTRLAEDRNDLEATFERMRLGAIQGIVLDADDSVIYDWYDEFGISAEAEVNFDLTNPDVDIVKTLNNLWRSMSRSSKGLMFSRVSILCDDDFWDLLTNHPKIRESYLNYQQAQAVLPGGISTPWSEYRLGRFAFMNYRGTDDQSTIALKSGKCKMFPSDSRGLFEHVMSPGEEFGMIGTQGQQFYADNVIDPSAYGNFSKAKYTTLETRAYPMFMCSRPEVLRSGRAS